MIEKESLIDVCLSRRPAMTGEQLRWLRKHVLEWNINDLAGELDVTRATVRRWEMAEEVSMLVALAMRCLLSDDCDADEVSMVDRIAEKLRDEEAENQ